MAKVCAIAFNTFKEAVRNRILYILLIFAVVLLLFSGVVRELTISAQEKVIRSLGLGCINIFGLLIAVFVGIGLVYNELDKKTIYTIISKPIDRWQFILGKYFGLLLTIYVNVFIMTVFFYFSLYIQALGTGATLSSFVASLYPLHIVILMTCFELAIVTAFAILYSSFSTPTLSAILTVFTFVIGRGNEDIIRYCWYLEREGLDSFVDKLKHSLAWFAAHIAPNLKIFYSDTAFHALSDPPVVLDKMAMLYGIAYTALILSLAIVIFRRRSFK